MLLQPSVTPEAQRFFVRIYRAISSTGIEPVGRSIIELARRHGVTFRDGEARSLFFELGRDLEGTSFADFDPPQRGQLRPAAATPGDCGAIALTTGDSSAVPIDDCGPLRPAAALARAEVSLTRGDTDYEIPASPLSLRPLSPQLFETAEAGKAAKRVKPDTRSARAIGAHAIRDAIGALVKPHLRRMLVSRWKQINASAAEALFESGETAESCAAFWRYELERTGSPVISLSKLHERMTLDAVREQFPPARRGRAAAPYTPSDEELE